MSARCFVDTNILVYAHDTTAGEKHRRARALVEELWRTRQGVISVQVLHELCVNLRRRVKRPLDPATLREILEDYLAWQVVTLEPSSVLDALEIERRHQVSFWDALIIHAACLSGATVLYTEDLSDGRFYDSVQVHNPLSASG